MIINKGKAKKLEDWDIEKVDYRVAIPSYQRSETIVKKTLNTLKLGGIISDKIDIFVANEEEYRKYKKDVPQDLYCNVIIGVLGMRNIRNFIQDYYEEGQYLVCLDDDIENIIIALNEKTIKPLKNLDKLFCYAFTVCNEVNAKYWGVYAVNNPYFMNQSIACGLRFLEGSMWGMILDKNKFRYLELDEKEDFERSIKGYLLDGNVIRLDFISFKSKEFTEKGGMQYDGQRTEERNIASGQYLIQKYPFVCRRNRARKKRFEVSLVEQRPEYKNMANWRIPLQEK